MSALIHHTLSAAGMNGGKKLHHGAKREPAFIFSQHSYSFWKILQPFTSVLCTSTSTLKAKKNISNISKSKSWLVN